MSSDIGNLCDGKKKKDFLNVSRAYLGTLFSTFRAELGIVIAKSNYTSKVLVIFSGYGIIDG